MPYIKSEDRHRLATITEEYHFNEIRSAGELNYLITKLVKAYISKNGENYQHYNDALGALEGAKLELYRRSIAPYENVKIEENGDVK